MTADINATLVTDMDFPAAELWRLYCNRGDHGNCIEGKCAVDVHHWKRCLMDNRF